MNIELASIPRTQPRPLHLNKPLVLTPRNSLTLPNSNKAGGLPGTKTTGGF